MRVGAVSTLTPEKIVFMSIGSKQKDEAAAIAKKFAGMGFELFGTRGTAERLRAAGLDCKVVFKVNEGRPNVVDLIKDRKISLIVNTPAGASAFEDERAIRRAAAAQNIPCISMLTAGRAAAEGIEAKRQRTIQVRSLQELHVTETPEAVS